MTYTIITENDTSEWKDKTGEIYHFPKRYLTILPAGAKVIYYKGKVKSATFIDKRLSSEPHYFATAEIGRIYVDPASRKEDYYAEIKNFIPFSKAVLAKKSNGYFESIPASRVNNYWRDGVRNATQEIYASIVDAADIVNDVQLSNDLYQGSDKSLESYEEGTAKVVYTTTYERNPVLRLQAILCHGYSCMACGFNFGKTFGEWGAGFIHVHHTKPLHEGQRKVNPQKDLIVLCANCHAMVHRRRVKTLTLGELKDMIRKNG